MFASETIRQISTLVHEYGLCSIQIKVVLWDYLIF